MNDDFLKKHQARPDVEFVENLYQTLETSEKKRVSMFFKRSSFSLRHKMVTLLVIIGLMITAAGAFPTPRGMILDWWNPADKMLVDSSRTLEPIAIGTQIESDEIFDPAVDIVEKEPQPQRWEENDFRYLPYTELATEFPAFTLPSFIPAGYELRAEGAMVFNNGDISIVWLKGKENYISYSYGDNANINQPGTELFEDHAPYFFKSSSNGVVDGRVLTGVKDGYFHTVSTDDLTLSDEFLTRLIPQELFSGPAFTAYDDPVVDPTPINTDINIDINYFFLSEAQSLNSNMVSLKWKISGPGSFSLFWRPENEVIVIQSGESGVYETEVELPSDTFDEVQFTLMTTGENSSRQSKSLTLSRLIESNNQDYGELPIGTQAIPFEELEDRFPNFTVPTNIPEGYELVRFFTLDDGTQVEGARWDDESLSLSWTKGGTHFISYIWGIKLMTSGNEFVIDAEGRVSPADRPDFHAPEFHRTYNQPGIESNLAVIGRLDGWDHSIQTNDLTLSKKNLLQMLPKELLESH